MDEIEFETELTFANVSKTQKQSVQISHPALFFLSGRVHSLYVRLQNG